MQKTQVRSLVGKIPWRREWLPTPVFLPGTVHGQRWATVHGDAESDTTEQLTLSQGKWKQDKFHHSQPGLNYFLWKILIFFECFLFAFMKERIFEGHHSATFSASFSLCVILREASNHIFKGMYLSILPLAMYECSGFPHPHQDLLLSVGFNLVFNYFPIFIGRFVFQFCCKISLYILNESFIGYMHCRCFILLFFD